MTTVGSLCSGYGGLDMGLELALGVPLRHAWHVEYDKHPSAILAHRFPNVPNYGDVKTTDWAEVEPVDWLTAGYPCQPFSLAGLRKGADDPRHLWPGVAAAIRVLRPGGVLLENVAAHLRDGFDTVLADLAGMGYDARWGVVRASDAGAPHGRARLFVVAEPHDGGSRHGRTGPSGRAVPLHVVRDGDAADAASKGSQGLRSEPEGRGPERGGAADADPQGLGRGEGRAEPARLLGGPDAPERGLSAPADAEGSSRRTRLVGSASERRQGDDEPGGSASAWGTYAPAIARWESVTARPAPRPTEPGRNGERLSPRFVEWMIGLPAGWVTDVPGLPRNAQLKALGNGVVPQQCALAVRALTARAAA